MWRGGGTYTRAKVWADQHVSCEAVVCLLVDDMQEAWKAREAELVRELEEVRAHAASREAEVEERVTQTEQEINGLLPELQAASNSLSGGGSHSSLELFEASKTSVPSP